MIGRCSSRFKILAEEIVKPTPLTARLVAVITLLEVILIIGCTRK